MQTSVVEKKEELKKPRRMPDRFVLPMHKLLTQEFPMFPDWIPNNIKDGSIEVFDKSGNTLSITAALQLLGSDYA